MGWGWGGWGKGGHGHAVRCMGMQSTGRPAPVQRVRRIVGVIKCEWPRGARLVRLWSIAWSVPLAQSTVNPAPTAMPPRPPPPTTTTRNPFSPIPAPPQACAGRNDSLRSLSNTIGVRNAQCSPQTAVFDFLILNFSDFFVNVNFN